MLKAGVARVDLTPFHGVELTGWGYYIERRWRTVRDALHATALAVDDGGCAAIVVALDLMVIDAAFTARTRARIREATGVPEHAILLTCSHTHNAPSAGGLLGAGACDPFYEDWASRQAATAAILAWERREPAVIRAGATQVDTLTFNRTRADGVVDPTLSVACLERPTGEPMAVLVNFGAHPTVGTELYPWAVSRDVPGEVCDHLEQALPGAMAMYLQGACGDVNFHRAFTDPARRHEPAQALASAALKALAGATVCQQPVVAAVRREVSLPTRRWAPDEILRDRHEAQRRLRDEDWAGWREGFGRAMTNRPDDMVRRHGGDEAKAVRAMCRFHLEWTEKALADLDTRPQTLATEAQALRIGDLYLVANASEFFSPFARDVRDRSDCPTLMVACYANGRIGYLPDAHDIAAKSYAGYQSPKYCDQFPYTEAAGPVMCDAMVRALRECRGVGQTGLQGWGASTAVEDMDQAPAQARAWPQPAQGWQDGLTSIVNARGTYTPLGVSRSSPAVRASVAEALGAFVRVDELHRKVAADLARLAGAQAGLVTHCTASSLTVAVAALMAGDDPQRVARLPDARGMRHRVVLPAGHDVDYGHPLTAALRLAGADVQVVDGGPEALAVALRAEDVAGLLSVSSRLVHPSRALDPVQAAALAHGAGVPLVIDAAAQDLRLAELVAAGADLVLVSAQKYLAGPTAGLIVGTEPLVRACLAQERGIGRTMKPTKEALAGVWTALQERRRMDFPAWQGVQRRKVRALREALEGLPGLRAEALPDAQGLPFERLHLWVDAARHRGGAPALEAALRCADPSIWVMDHLAEQDVLMLELVPLQDPEIVHIAACIRAWAEGRSAGIVR